MYHWNMKTVSQYVEGQTTTTTNVMLRLIQIKLIWELFWARLLMSPYISWGSHITDILATGSSCATPRDRHLCPEQIHGLLALAWEEPNKESHSKWSELYRGTSNMSTCWTVWVTWWQTDTPCEYYVLIMLSASWVLNSKDQQIWVRHRYQGHKSTVVLAAV